MPYIIFFVSFLIYSLSSSNGILWDNNGRLMLYSNILFGMPFEFSTVLMLGGKIFTLIPFGTISFRLNLFTSLFGALNIVLFYIFLIKFMQIWATYDKNFAPFLSAMALDKLKRLMKLIAFLSSFVFCLSHVLWLSSIQFQASVIMLFFLILLFILFLKICENYEANKWVYIFFLCTGIAIANDIKIFNYSLIFIIPTLWIKRKIIMRYPTFLIGCLLFFLIGFSIILSSIIRNTLAAQELLSINVIFDYVEYKRNFFHFFRFPIILIPFKITSIIQIILSEIPGIFIFLAFLGFPAAMQPKRRLWIPFIFIIIINILTAFKYNSTQADLFLPTFFTLFSISALGSFTFFLIFFSKSIENNPPQNALTKFSALPQIILLFMIFLAIVLQILRNRDNFSERDNYSSEIILKKSAENIPLNSIIHYNSSDILGPMLYLRFSENFRKDIELFSRFDMIGYSDLSFKNDKKVFLDSSTVIKNNISSANLIPNRLYYEYNSKNLKNVSLQQWGQNYIETSNILNEAIKISPVLIKEKSNLKYYIRLKNKFLYIIYKSGMKKEPVNEWKEDIFRYPDFSDSSMFLIQSYIENNEIDKAKKLLTDSLIPKFPDISEVRYYRAKFFIADSDLKRAKRELILSLKLDPGNQHALIELATIYINQNQKDEASDLINRLLNINPRNLEGIKIKQQLYKY